MRVALVVHAHPDDEVFATAAATAALGDAGWRVVLRVATGGEASESGGLSEAEARDRRAARLTGSCQLLGITEWDWLAGPGRWIDEGGEPGRRSLSTDDSDDLAEAIRASVSQVRPDLILTVGRDGLTGHPDHVAVASAVQEARGTVEAWGAVLRASDVRAAYDHLARIAPGQVVGSGRVTGSPDQDALRVMTGGNDTERRRRQALDRYVEGLGTHDLEQVLAGGDRHGDSALLRVVLDLAGWEVDRFEPL